MSTYLDNAATSFPKPPCMAEAINEFILRQGGSPGRSSHSKSIEASEIVDMTRGRINNLLGGYGPESICFTSNASEALNTCILGGALEGDTVVTTTLEHNSVVRPIYMLLGKGCSHFSVRVRTDGITASDDVLEAIERESPDIIVVGHASNVTGRILDIAPIAKACREKDILLIIDGAQTAGHIPINISKLEIPIFCFTGHKGLLGPQGIGGFIIHPDWVDRIEPLKHGGTGVESSSPCQPKKSPEKYEVGTLNTIGIVGLGASIGYLGGLNTRKKETYLRERLRIGLSKIEGITLLGPEDNSKSVGIVSITSSKMDPVDLGFILDAKYNIQVRAGLHCAPEAHKALGTFPLGTVRFSVSSAFTSNGDIDEAIAAVQEVSEGESHG